MQEQLLILTLQITKGIQPAAIILAADAPEFTVLTLRNISLRGLTSRGENVAETQLWP
jgi:hypothetical protein